MTARPNRTTVEAEVVGVNLAADGVGGDVALKVGRNTTADPAHDFIRPDAGAVVKAFAADPGELAAGGWYRVRLRLNAGPAGGRVVVEQADPLPG